MRAGTGYDVHRFDDSRPLVLGGVEFPGHPGLAGHSDADVLTHAIIDALLGAAGLGDIGTHFPPDDDHWAGASSLAMLGEAVRMVTRQGLYVVNVDSTVIAEAPKLSPHIPAMRDAIAAAIGVDTAQVNVKATTNEGLGAIGRGEGIAALAIAVLE